MSERYVDDADWATAAEQSSEDDEAQEGNMLLAEERAVEPAEHVALHVVDDVDDQVGSDEDEIDVDDPEADAIVNDALNLDEAAESAAAAEVLNDSIAEEEAERAADEAAEVTPYDGPDINGDEDEPVLGEDFIQTVDAANSVVDDVEASVDPADAPSQSGGPFSDDSGSGVGSVAPTGAADVEGESAAQDAVYDDADVEDDDDVLASVDGDPTTSVDQNDVDVENGRPLGATAPVPDEDAADRIEVETDDADADPYDAFRSELRSQPGKWYVIHSYAGFERKVKANIEQRKSTLEVEDDIYQIEVPMEDVVEIKNGQRKMVTRVRIPGYVLVRMELNEDTWSVVRHTPGVTGFVGNAHNPTPLRFEEAFTMLKSLVEVKEVAPAKTGATKGAPATARSIPAEVDFEIGETITIKEGSFAGLPGSISEIKPESGKLTVLVSLFERETPVELSFDQVTKL